MARPPGPEYRWGALSRLSKADRHGTDESNRRQDLTTIDYIKTNNLGIVAATYSEVASAYAEGAKRPQFEAMLTDLERGTIDGIIVWKIDRLVRRVADYRHVLDVLQKAGGRLIAVADNIDTADPDKAPTTGLILDLLARLAEMEARNTSERQVQAQQFRARQGKRSGGGTRPFGHSLDWFSLVPEEADAIRDAAKRVLNGKGVYSIVQDWNENGPRPVKAEQWTTQVLGQILLSPRLVAKRDYGDDLFDLEDVPAILNFDVWERVCAKLSDPKPITSPRTYRLLSGLALCGHCETPLRGGKNMESRGGKPLYACPPKSRGQGSCGSLSVNGEPVDEIVSERVVEWLSDKRNITNLLAKCSLPEAEALTLQVADLNDALVDLSRALKERKIRYGDYAARYDEIVAEREELQRKLAVTRETSLLVETLSVEWTPEEWDSRPTEWKRAVLRLCTKRIEVKPVGKTTGATRNGFVFDKSRVRVEFVV
jgi:site-specific DNA recombinase